MSPLFKRIFGQGKSKAASNTLVALCIGDYSRITLPIEGKEAHQLQALLAHEVAADEGSPGSSQPAQTKSTGLGTQASFRAFRHILQQHFGGGTASSSSQDGGELDAQQQFAAFLKNLGGYPSVSFLSAGDDGLVSRDKVLAKLTKLFKHSTAPVVLVSYCGPSDERGNWRLASQASGGSAGNSGTGGIAAAAAAAAGGASAAAAGAGRCVVSFREVSMLWQRYRKHSQRLVLLLDCANSGYWVSALRMLSKAEQLELSLGVQASDCSLPAMQSMQLTYQPGIFVKFYLTNNKWRGDSRRNAPGNSQQQQQGASAGPNTDITISGGGGSIAGGNVARSEQWLPGMLPSYYATWLSDNLVDYGIALRFFNTQVTSLAVPSASTGGVPAPAATASSSGGGGGGRIGDGPSPEPPCDPLFPISPMCAATIHNSVWRASTGPLAAIDSSRSLGGPSRLVDELTSPSSDQWCSPRSLGAGGGGGVGGAGATGPSSRGPTSELDTHEHGSMDRVAMRSTMNLRAVSMQESARRRFSTLYYENCTAEGSGPATTSAALVGSPGIHPAMQRVRLSTPQAADFQGNCIVSPSTLMPGRSPTLPGDESLYRMGQEIDPGSAATLSHIGSNVGSHLLSPSASALGDMACGPGRLHGRGSGAPDQRLSMDAPVAPAPAAPQLPLGQQQQRVAAACCDSVPATDSVLGTAEESPYHVQASAQSDTVAVHWDRRSTHAERCLQVENGAGKTASFTNAPNGGRAGGFVNELYGALHEVATDRRLRARRAPLEGDESLDTMMEDADLERRVSVASLPSAMLPRDLMRDHLARGGGGGGVSGRLDSSGSIGGVMLPSGAAPPPSGRVDGGFVAAAALPTPRTSALLGLAEQGVGDVAGPGALAAAGSDAASSRTQQRVTRQVSRLFVMSVASAVSTGGGGGQLSAGQMDELAEADDGGADVGDMEELSMTGSFADRTEDDGEEAVFAEELEQGERGSSSASAQRQQQLGGGKATSPFAAVAAAGSGGAFAGGGRQVRGMTDVAAKLLGTHGSAELPAGAVGAAASLEWPQPADSPAPTPIASMVASGHYELRRGGGGSIGAGGLPSGTSGALLRNLLKQQVSIADSMDLDSVSMGGGQPAMWQRRPGRFEVAGSETSSILFGDDKERFDELRMLRGHEDAEPYEEEEAVPPQQAGQAAPRRGWAPLASNAAGAGPEVAAADAAALRSSGATQGVAAAYQGDLLLSMECADGRWTAGSSRA